MSKFIHLLLIFTLMVHVFTPFVFAEDSLTDLEKQINDLKSKIESAQTQERTLAAEIKSMTDKIQLTTLEISETTSKIAKLAVEIEELGTKIGRLDVTLSKLSQLLINRVVASYKLRRVSPFVLLLSSANFTDGLKKIKFLQTAQEHDREVLVEVQLAKVDYSEKKDLREEKKKQLEELKKQLDQQKIKLDQQKISKENLLKITRNDEATYQRLLATVQAELEAIKSILAGSVQETQIRHANEGDKIATLLSGASCNSTGTHLHFIVSKNGESFNPFNYLRSGINSENLSGGDPFNPSGSWRWPLSEKIILTQGYGITNAIRNNPWLHYDFHNGIDIYSISSSSVYAVKSGTLYKGAFAGNGCSLPYVKVDHDDSDMNTFYLHVYPS